jgi:uncharacterized membrane protein
MNKSANKYFISTNRIETLVDGVFAIAMTLMVLNIHLPDASGVWTNEMVWGIIWGQITNLFIYALTFIILASFWISHHRGFNHLKRADTGFLWINIIWLLFVALVPYSTSLMGDFGYTIPASLFFNINLFFIGLFSFLIRHHVIEYELADKTLDPDDVNHVYMVTLIFPVFAALAAVLSLFTPAYSTLLYMMIPIVIKIIHIIQNAN